MFAEFGFARAVIRSRAPWFLPAVMLMRVVESHDVKSMAVSRDAVLYVNPKFIAGMQPSRLATYLCHEAMHVMRAHHQRFVDTGAHESLLDLWNIAVDCEINDDLKLALDPDPNWFYPKNIGAKDGFTGEQYFAHLRAQPPDQQPKAGENAGQGACGSGAGKPQPGEPQQGARGAQPSGGSPSGEDGAPGAVDGRGEPVDGAGEGATPAEITAARAAFASAVKDAVNNAKFRGLVPAGLARWADDFERPAKVRWQDRLRRLVSHGVDTRPGAMDRTYERPSRRQGGVGFGAGRPLLARSIEFVPRVAVSIDTSGSMSQKDVSAALTEVRGVLKTGVQIELTSCDAAMSSVVEIKSVAELRMRGRSAIAGGGGTDFIPVVEHFGKRPADKRPAVLIYLTDGQGAAPRFPPKGMKIIWAIIGDERNFAAVEPMLSKSGAVLRVAQ